MDLVKLEMATFLWENFYSNLAVIFEKRVDGQIIAKRKGKIKFISHQD
jgi:hypothetical protein